jgi:SAM-dependent methyltransferase
MSANPIAIPARAPGRRMREIAQMIDSQGIFAGGPLRDFEIAGRLQLATLLREGIWPQSRVLDVGCGCLRGGYWLIHFLDPGCYFGIEPNAPMLQQGIDHLMEPEALKEKRPCFDTNDRFDLSVFGVKFDIVLARSIWTHSSKGQIGTMLDGFVANSSADAFFLTSYFPAGFWKNRDYKGNRWIGRSHQSEKPGTIHHSFRWIEEQVKARGMFVRQLPDLVFNEQYWLKICRSDDAIQDADYSFR